MLVSVCTGIVRTTDSDSLLFIAKLKIESIMKVGNIGGLALEIPTAIAFT